MKIWQEQNSSELIDQGPALNSWPRSLKKYLQNKGFHQNDSVLEFLKEDLQSLKSPLQLKGMREACFRIEKAFLNKEKICVYADFDLDGTSGCALLKKGFEDLGFENVLHFQPKRLKDGYGFHAPVVEDLAALGVSLIITCDVGITAVKACAKAKELGLDVIITDHHLPAGDLPEALLIINPNQPSDESGLGYLSGAGVGFYLMRALKRHFTDQNLGNHQNLNLKELLDCFTIATLTDMVPLVGDNRVLVQVGMRSLSQTKRPGLAALMAAVGLAGKKLTSGDVAIRFAPKLNALSRLEGEILPLDLYLMTDYAKAESMITQVLFQNQERVSLQAEALKEALEIVGAQKDQSCHVVVSENFHRGVIGLIATSLAQSTQKPCFVGSLDLEENKIVGSCRRPEDSESSLVEALTSVSNHLLRFGGHAQAAGFETDLKNINEVTLGLQNFFNQQVQKVSVSNYDSEIKWHELNWDLVEKLDKLEPFGVGFEAPVFYLENVRIKSYKTLKGGHLKFELTKNSESETFQALLFSPSPRQTQIVTKRSDVDLLIQVQTNEWKGNRTLQLLVEDVRETLFETVQPGKSLEAHP